MSENDENFDISNFKAGDSFFGQMKEAGVADDAFVREIVEMFINEGNTSLKIIAEAFQNEDQQQVRLYGHKLKSSFLMFDMHDAHALAVKLEEAEAPLEASLNAFNALQKICNRSFKLVKLKYLT